MKKALEVVDLGILLGFPFKSLSLTKVADILSSKMEPSAGEVCHSVSGISEPCAKRPKLDNELNCLHCPSVEFFYNNHFSKAVPVKMVGCIDHWPALKLWKDLNYIVKKAGHRMVPVELGKHYVDDTYSQKLMKVSDFVKDFFREDAQEIGYLAQHQLFDQVILVLFKKKK